MIRAELSGHYRAEVKFPAVCRWLSRLASSYGNDVDCDRCGAWAVFHIAARLGSADVPRQFAT
jgi:hypothetical protein